MRLILARRQFLGLSGLGTVLVFTAGFKGCTFSFSSVETQIKNYLPVVVQAATNIIALLASVGILPGITAPIATALLTEVKNLVADALAAVDEYTNAPADQKATILGKIRTILSSISDQFATFVADLTQLKGNPIATVIGAIISLIASTLGGFVNAIPVPAGAKLTVAATSIRVAGTTVAVTPQKRSRSEFVKEFNAALGAKYATYCLW